KHAGLVSYVCDVTDPAKVKELVAAVSRDHGGIDILVNNAGAIQTWDIQSVAQSQDLSEAEGEIQLNLVSPIRLTAAFLPTLLKRPEAAVINITGGLAYVPIARYAIYCATKAALNSLTKSLRHQLEKTAVRVFEILPPATKTEMYSESDVSNNMKLIS